MPDVEVEELRDAHAIAALSPEWEQSGGGEAPGSPFLEPAYVALWCQLLGQAIEPRVLTLRGDGILRGYAPLMLAQDSFGPLATDTLRFIGNNVGHPGDILYAEVWAAEPRPPAVEALLRHVKDSWSVSKWDLGYLAPDSDTQAIAHRLLRLTPGDLAANPYQSYVSLALPPTWEDYLSSLSRNTRQHFRRRLRRLGDLGEVRVAVDARPDGVERRLREAMANHDASWGDTYKAGWFGGEEVRRFAIEGARLLAERGHYRAFALELDGRAIAWNFGAVDQQRYFEQTLSYDPRYADHSPGATLTISLARELLSEGVHRVEFGPGDYQRKRSAGGSPQTHVRFTWYRGWRRPLARMWAAFRRRSEPK